MSKTDLAEGILRTYIESSSIGPGNPDYPQFKAECDSIRVVLRMIDDRNQNARRSAASLSDVRQSRKEPSCT